jgi:hypothetical protein
MQDIDVAKDHRDPMAARQEYRLETASNSRVEHDHVKCLFREEPVYFDVPPKMLVQVLFSTVEVT